MEVSITNASESHGPIAGKLEVDFTGRIQGNGLIQPISMTASAIWQQPTATSTA